MISSVILCSFPQGYARIQLNSLTGTNEICGMKKTCRLRRYCIPLFSQVLQGLVFERARLEYLAFVQDEYSHLYFSWEEQHSGRYDAKDLAAKGGGLMSRSSLEQGRGPLPMLRCETM